MHGIKSRLSGPAGHVGYEALVLLLRKSLIWPLVYVAMAVFARSSAAKIERLTRTRPVGRPAGQPPCHEQRVGPGLGGHEVPVGIAVLPQENLERPVVGRLKHDPGVLLALGLLRCFPDPHGLAYDSAADSEIFCRLRPILPIGEPRLHLSSTS